MGKFLHNRFNRCCPYERLGVFIPNREVFFNRGNKSRDTDEDAAPYSFPGQLSKPAFYKIQPARTGRNEVEYKAWMPVQLTSDVNSGLQ